MRETLAVRGGPLAAYTSSAETVMHGSLQRTKLTPVALTFRPETLNVAVRWIAKLVLRKMPQRPNRRSKLSETT